MDDVDRALERATGHLSRREFEQALEVCDQAIALNPADPRPYRERAHVFAIILRWDDAVSDADRVLGFAPGDRIAGDYFFRGYWSVNAGRFEEAIDHLTKALKVEAEQCATFYMESAYFYRADALQMCGRFAEALRDCERVRADFLAPSRGRLRTRAEIIAAAQAGRGRRDGRT